MAATTTDAILRFDSFELNLDVGELRKAGRKVKIQDLPLRILAVLLEQPGQLVAREVLRERLWAADTFVDFDHSLNTAIKKLRQALNDEAEKPKYIETLPKRGYRYIGSSVISVSAVRPQGISVSGPSPGNGSERDSGRETDIPVISWRTHLVHRWILGVFATALAAASIAGVFGLHRHTSVLSEKDSVLLSDFANLTGDAVFAGALRQGLGVQLEQSPFLNVVSEQQVHQTLQMMGKKTDEKLTREVSQELCQRTGSSAVIDGSIAQIGDRYLLTVKAIDCGSGKSLASAEAQASDKNHVLDALGKSASELRNKLGESLSTVQKFDTPLEQATTPSLEALKAFSSGRRAWNESGPTAAIPFYRSAIDLDEHFAMSFAWLGLMNEEIGESNAAGESLRRAYELRERTSAPEKYFISSLFYKTVTGDMEKAEQSCRLWIQTYPRSELPHNFLSGAIYPVLGQYEKGVIEGKIALHLNPGSPGPYFALGSNYMALNELELAKATYQQAAGRNLDHYWFHSDLYKIAFLQEDQSAMSHQTSWSTGKPRIEDELLQLAADTSAFTGQLKNARGLSRRAMESADMAGEKESVGIYTAVAGLREALFGNASDAQRLASQAAGITTSRDVQYGAALAFAFAGDNPRAQALVDRLAKDYPESTIVRFNYLPTLRARLAINQGNADEAIEFLRIATPYETGVPTGTYPWAGLYPVFVRGQAYLSAHEAVPAAAEFQKILDHRGVAINEPISALAILGLARAYAMQGDTPKASLAYQRFLSLWGSADVNIPVLKQSKVEYARLP
jgi:DNA-binding winged helix-turn-helix (wHTH) protein/tetratricopeptide (TPR) repeat protein